MSYALQQIFLPAVVSWGFCILAGNNIAVALWQQEQSRAARIAAGLAWTAQGDAGDRLAAEQQQDRQLFMMPEDDLVQLVQHMLSVRGRCTALLPMEIRRVAKAFLQPDS